MTRSRERGRASPKCACTGKTARRPPRVAKPVMGTGTPSGSRRAAIHSPVRGGRELGASQGCGLALPCAREHPLLGGRESDAIKVTPRPTTPGPNPGGGPAGHQRPVGGTRRLRRASGLSAPWGPAARRGQAGTRYPQPTFSPSHANTRIQIQVAPQIESRLAGCKCAIRHVRRNKISTSRWKSHEILTVASQPI